MIILNRKIDEWIVIGQTLRVAATDIDAGGVRVRACGQLVGGADDGLAIDASYELAIGSNLRLGTLVSLTLLKVMLDTPRRAEFGIQVPPNIVVQQKPTPSPDRERGEAGR
jgi:hypothetical protein